MIEVLQGVVYPLSPVIGIIGFIMFFNWFQSRENLKKYKITYKTELKDKTDWIILGAYSHIHAFKRFKYECLPLNAEHYNNINKMHYIFFIHRIKSIEKY